MSLLCTHFIVTGTVQGVFFRNSTKAKAHALNLTGWVRNREDGSVELVACGEAASLKDLETWLWQGPSGARVTQVMGSPCDWQTHSKFSIL